MQCQSKWKLHWPFRLSRNLPRESFLTKPLGFLTFVKKKGFSSTFSKKPRWFLANKIILKMREGNAKTIVYNNILRCVLQPTPLMYNSHFQFQFLLLFLSLKYYSMAIILKPALVTFFTVKTKHLFWAMLYLFWVWNLNGGSTYFDIFST